MRLCFTVARKEKMIRWLKTEEIHGQFITTVSRPASLAPFGDGQRQLLTILSKFPAELGLDFPQITVSDTNESVKITSFIGEGATSVVYAATFGGNDGVLKLLKHGFEGLADHELLVLSHLQQSQVCGIPTYVTKIREGALFFGEELTHVDFLDREKLCSLLDCLRGAHEAGVIHRDVRPDNIMQNGEGNVCLIDWGFSFFGQSLDASPPEFQGTFRYASDEVLSSAILKSARHPKPKDDLESLSRVVLSQLSPSLRTELAEIHTGDLTAAQAIWANKRKENPGYEWIFATASSGDYDSLKAAIFG